MLWCMRLHICVKEKGGFTLHRYQISTQQWQSKYVKLPAITQLLNSSSSLPFNSCWSTGRRRYSTTPPNLVPCSPLRSSSVSCFPAPSQLSSSMCSLVSWQPWGVQLRGFFVILLPAFVIVCPIQVHFLRVIVVSMESCSAMFHNSLLVILSFQLMLKVVELWCEKSCVLPESRYLQTSTNMTS